jgi:hypothetical protein
MRAAHLLSYLCFLVALSVAPLCESGGSAPTRPSLSFTASPVNPSFHEGEKVVLRFTIENVSGSDVLVSPAFILNYDIHLEIEGASGKAIPWCGVVARLVILGDKFVTLHPGKSFSMSRQISCDDTHDSGYSFPGPGEYSVAATHRFPVSPKKLRDNPGPVPFASGPYKAEMARLTVVPRKP